VEFDIINDKGISIQDFNDEDELIKELHKNWDRECVNCDVKMLRDTETRWECPICHNIIEEGGK
jgi:hypothetical protein